MELTSYVIIGALVSVIVQIIKNKFGTSSTGTLLAVSIISVVVGAGYYFVKETPFWEPILSILGFAGAVYTYIFQRFEK